MDLLTKIKYAWKRHQAFRAALAELNTYSNSELYDLHISRADVVPLAWEEADRRIARDPSLSPGVRYLARHAHAA